METPPMIMRIAKMTMTVTITNDLHPLSLNYLFLI